MERNLLNRVVAAATSAALLALSGCTLPWRANGSGTTRPPGTRLDLPRGDLAAVAWLPDGYLYTLRQPPDVGTPTEIWRARPGQKASRLTLPGMEGCTRVDYLLPHALPDGRLGLARFCQAEQSRIDLVAADPTSGRLEVLAPLGDVNPTGVTWHRDLTTGFVTHGSGICDGFAPLTRQGPGSFGAPVTLDGHTWALDEDFRRSGADDCRADGRAFAATLTPDGQRLLFLAVPQAQGHSGQRRIDFPTSVWVRDLPDGKPHVLARGFTTTTGMAIDPDGRHLAIAGRRGDQHGVWLVDTGTGATRTITGASLYGAVFSPDGRQLAALYRPGKYEDFDAQLWVFDAP